MGGGGAAPNRTQHNSTPPACYERVQRKARNEFARKRRIDCHFLAPTRRRVIYEPARAKQNHFYFFILAHAEPTGCDLSLFTLRHSPHNLLILICDLRADGPLSVKSLCAFSLSLELIYYLFVCLLFGDEFRSRGARKPE